MPDNLFAYGTLMEPRIIAEIIGRTPSSQPAELRGYRRQRIRGELYPGIQPAADATTPGLIYFDLAPEEMALLDAFEGAFYENRPVALRTPSGEEHPARAYVIRPAYRHLLLDAPWDYDDFQKRFVKRFAREYQGFR